MANDIEYLYQNIIKKQNSLPPYCVSRTFNLVMYRAHHVYEW